ncbi:MAG: hypothetical protein RR365_07305, partial [Bacteroides sp.]
GKTRDVDEYNRRYDARNNDFEMEDDTLYIKEKDQPDLEGEWSNGEFNGSRDDYEYAERIIRFRNPRYAISISSPLYWDVVYGMNSWDWNVYSDGLYAYAFPTFTNRLWWDWRFNSYGGGWGLGFGSSYYGWGGYPGFYAGWGGWGGSWGCYHHPSYYPGYYPGWGGSSWGSSNRTYTNRRSYGGDRYTGTSVRRSSSSSSDRYSQVRRGSSVSSDRRSEMGGTRRVVGTRSSSERIGMGTRTDASSTRRNTYTRPSSTRGGYDAERVNSVRSSRGMDYSGSRPSVESSSRTSSSYSRGSSTSPVRSSSVESTRRSYDNSSSSRSYSPRSSSSSSRSSSSYSGSSSSSRSSSGSGGGSSRSSRR